MKIKIKKTSDYSFSETREITTLEDLINIEKEFHPDNGLIISFDVHTYEDAPVCYIYDDYWDSH